MPSRENVPCGTCGLHVPSHADRCYHKLSQWSSSSVFRTDSDKQHARWRLTVHQDSGDVSRSKIVSCADAPRSTATYSCHRQGEFTEFILCICAKCADPQNGAVIKHTQIVSSFHFLKTDVASSDGCRPSMSRHARPIPVPPEKQLNSVSALHPKGVVGQRSILARFQKASTRWSHATFEKCKENRRVQIGRRLKSRVFLVACHGTDVAATLSVSGFLKSSELVVQVDGHPLSVTFDTAPNRPAQTFSD